MLRKFLLTGIGLVLIGLSRFAFNEVSQLKYGLEHTGKLNVALSLAFLFSMPAVTSFVPAALRFVTKARGQGDDGLAYRTGLVLAAFTAVTLVFVSAGIVFYGEEIALSRQIELRHLHYAVFVLLAFGAYQFARNICYAMGRVGLYTVLETAAGIAFVVALGSLIYFDARDQLLLAFAAAYLVFSLLAFLVFARPPKASPIGSVPFSAIWSFSFWAFLGTSASWGIREISVIISPDFANLEGAAHLGWCVAFLTPMQFLPRMVRTVIFADTAERSARGEDEAAASSVSNVSHWIAILNLPLCGLLILISGELLELLTHNTRPDYIHVLQLMVFAIAFDILSTSSSAALSGSGHIKLNMLMSLLGLGAAILVWTLFGHDFGLLAVAGGLLAASVVRGTGLLIAGWKVLSISVTKQPVLCGGILLLTVLSFFSSDIAPNIWWIALAYCTAVLALLHRELFVLGQIIQQRFVR